MVVYFTLHSLIINTDQTSMAKKTIFIAEDDLDILELLQLLTEAEGYKTKSFSEIEKIELHIFKYRPSLILMDLWIAGRDSALAVKNLKKKKETAGIPIILISAKNSLEQIAKQCKADAFLKKPFNISDLTRLIKRFA